MMCMYTFLNYVEVYQRVRLIHQGSNVETLKIVGFKLTIYIAPYNQFFYWHLKFSKLP